MRHHRNEDVISMAEFASRSFYITVSAALSDLDSDVEPAECHGVLCGMLCSPDGFETAQWLRHLTGYPEGVTDELVVDGALTDLIHSTLRGMDSDDYGFELLLTDDDESLVLRTDALGSWCRGFLSGFGTMTGVSGISAESREFLEDLYKIGQVDPDEASNEVGEHAFLEIVEYTRMGTILLREESRHVTSSDVFEHVSVH
ncbi:MAG: YecA family protein [Gammaproteobacteria bacterium]|nr:YecA family protein [Gammaproteobacteria bacterium]